MHFEHDILNNGTFVIGLFGLFPLFTWKVLTNVLAGLRLQSLGSEKIIFNIIPKDGHP